MKRMTTDEYDERRLTGEGRACVSATIAPFLEECEQSALPNLQRLETVLLIEDHEALSRSLAIRLERSGYEVWVAQDGVTGLEMIREVEPDLILLDLGLPRMHGFKLLHDLRMSPGMGDAPIVIITGDPNPTIEERARKWGVVRVLRKPIRQKWVVKAVQEVLADRG